jgi:MFS family permease
VVLFAIFIAGFTCSAFLINTAYIAEICQESIRGAMITAIMVFYNIGMLVSYVLGGYLSYWNMVRTNLMIAIGSLLLQFVLNESPLYLLSKGREEVRNRRII